MTEQHKTITLDQPIQRGDNTIETIVLRKPKSGELRGLKMAEVINLDVNSLTRLLPRISEPALTEAEVQAMDPADLTECGLEVVNFLEKKKPSRTV